MESRPDDSMFASPSAVSDVTLIVDGKRLHVNKCVLGLASPVFLKMFEGDYKDKTEIPLADKKYEDMVELLLCIYPSTSASITRKSLDVVLPLADEYEIEPVKRRCEEFVLAQLHHHDDKIRNPPNEELVHFLYLADKYKLDKLLDTCVETAKYRTYEGVHGIKKLDEFKLLSVDGKFRVISARLCQVEVPVLDLLIKAQDKPIEERVDYTANPQCEQCKNDQWKYGHDMYSVKCRVTSVGDLKALSSQLYALSAYFRNNPNVRQNKK